MPLESIVYVTFVLSAVALLVSTLAYANGAARHANEPIRTPARFTQEKPRGRDNGVEPVRKAA